MNTLKRVLYRRNTQFFIQRAYATTKKKIPDESDEQLPSKYIVHNTSIIPSKRLFCS